jgi:[acyl-carrier-protein] S-malonyltransferase
MTLALLCSGQGLQSPDLFALTADAPAAAPIFAHAAAYLGCDPRSLVAQADPAELYANRIGQILCVTAALALAECVADILPRRCVVAGYSVGEMAAWGVAGIWTPEQVLGLTAARAEAMDAASRPGQGLAAIRGLPRATLDPLVARHACAIAIRNPADLFVVGGMSDALDALCAEAAQMGAARASRLHVGVASHTALLERAVDPFHAQLAPVPVRRPITGRILLNGTDGTPIFDAGRFRGALARQVATFVDWTACLDAVVERGAERSLELGPGHALADMMRTHAPQLAVRSADAFHTLSGLRAWIAET